MNFFYDNFSANFVISVVKFVDAGCRYHGKRGTVPNCPFIGLLFLTKFFLFSPVKFSRSRKFLPGKNKEVR